MTASPSSLSPSDEDSSPDARERPEAFSSSNPKGGMNSFKHRNSSVELKMRRHVLTPDSQHIVMVMVGLPARGKSFVSKKLERFLKWRGIQARIFNVGETRRKHGGDHSASFFDPTNSSTREAIAQGVLDELIEWLGASSDTAAAIFDATNSTVARRDSISARIRQRLAGCAVVFVESVCDDPVILERNLLQKVRCSPDYRDADAENALNDLRERVRQYELQYETLSNAETHPYIKLFNLSSQLHLHHIYGRMANSLVPYMMGIHVSARPIWLVRCAHCPGAEGQTSSPGSPVAGRPPPASTVVVDRSAKLSPEGLAFAKGLGAFCERRCKEFAQEDSELELEPECTTFTSTLPRAIQTASFVPSTHINASPALNPLDKGICYGLTEDEFRRQMAEEYALWSSSKRTQRFPGGESFQDLISRLEPMLIEIEQQTSPVLIVAHLSTLQVLYGYFGGLTLEQALESEIPHHTVMQLTPSTDAAMWRVEHMHLGADGEDTVLRR